MIIQNIRDILISINKLDSTGIIQGKSLAGCTMGFSLLRVRRGLIYLILNPFCRRSFTVYRLKRRMIFTIRYFLMIRLFGS